MKEKPQQYPKKNGLNKEHKQQKKSKRLPPNIWRAIKDNPAIAGLLATLVAAVIGLSGVLYQQYVSVGIAQRDAEQKQEIQDQQRQETEVQTYFDDIGKLLLDKDHPLHKANETDEVSILAQAKTLALLGGVDSEHKGSIIKFLHNARLIQGEGSIVKLQGISLESADLTNTDLQDANLHAANLNGADVRTADLRGADLSHADLSKVRLSHADLTNADLNHAALYSADLSTADLRGADLRGADMMEADLTDTDFTDAKGVNVERLEKGAISLKGATMPDGSKHT